MYMLYNNLVFRILEQNSSIDNIVLFCMLCLENANVYNITITKSLSACYYKKKRNKYFL